MLLGIWKKVILLIFRRFSQFTAFICPSHVRSAVGSCPAPLGTSAPLGTAAPLGASPWLLLTLLRRLATEQWNVSGHETNIAGGQSCVTERAGRLAGNVTSYQRQNIQSMSSIPSRDQSRTTSLSAVQFLENRSIRARVSGIIIKIISVLFINALSQQPNGQ